MSTDKDKDMPKPEASWSREEKTKFITEFESNLARLKELETKVNERSLRPGYKHTGV